MKKVLTIICLFAVTLLLVACGSKSNNSGSTTKKNDGGKKKESATFDSITLNEKGLLEWNKITGASYYYISSGYSKDDEKYIEGTSTQLRLNQPYEDPEYYNYYTVRVSACTTRSQENAIIKSEIKVVVQDGKFFLKEDAQKYTLTVHYADGKNIIKSKTYETPVIDITELYNDVDDNKYFISHSSTYSDYYRNFRYNMPGTQSFDYVQNQALSTDKEIYLKTFEIKGIHVKLYSWSGYLTYTETVYLEQDYSTFDTTVTYDGSLNPDLDGYKRWHYSSDNLIFNCNLRDLYNKDKFSYKDGILKYEDYAEK